MILLCGIKACDGKNDGIFQGNLEPHLFHALGPLLVLPLIIIIIIIIIIMKIIIIIIMIFKNKIHNNCNNNNISFFK